MDKRFHLAKKIDGDRRRGTPRDRFSTLFLTRIGWLLILLPFFLVFVSFPFGRGIPSLNAQETSREERSGNDYDSGFRPLPRDPEEGTGTDVTVGGGAGVKGGREFGGEEKRVKIREGISFWLFDNNGQWKIPLPNWSMEDIVEKLDSSSRKRDDLPFTIQSLNATGNASGDSVLLTIEYRINTDDTPVIRVPLGLKEGVYIPENDESGNDRNFRHEGPGDCYLDIDRQSGGYVAVIRNKTVPDEASSVSETGTTTNVDSGENSSSGSDQGTEGRSREEIEEESGKDFSDHSSDLSDQNPQEGGAMTEEGESNASESEGASEDSVMETGTGEGTDEEISQESPKSTPKGETSDKGGASGKIPKALLSLLNKEEETREDRFIRNRHVITITLSFPIDTLTEEDRRLAVSFTPAVTSRVTLDIPIPDLQMTVSEGTTALPPVNLNETTSEIILTGLSRTGAPTELIWRKKEERITDVPQVIQVENAEITAGPTEQGIQYETLLPIRSYGDRLDLIRIRLPENTHPIGDSIQVTGPEESQVGIHWEEKPETPEESGSPTGDVDGESSRQTSILEIRLAQSLDFALVRFKAMTQSHLQQPTSDPENEDSSNEEEWSINGFEVIGAQKQFGRLKVQIVKDLDYDLIPGDGIRSISATSEEEEDTELFSFFTQPFTLHARPILREARISVAPEYLIYVEKSQIKMTAHFRWTVHGAQVRRLYLRTADWFINEYDRDSPVDTGEIYHEPNSGDLTLPLKSATEGNIDVRLTASLNRTPNDGVLSFPVPVPVADWIEPAIVAIVSDDDIELTPVAEQMVDLVQKRQRSLNFSLEIPTRRNPPLYYQIQRSASGIQETLPLFAAKMTIHDQQVRVQSEATVQLLDQENVQVRQNLNYVIDYVPLNSISLIVPPELRDHPDLTIFVDGKPVSPSNVFTEPVFGSDPERFRKRVMFPENGRIGECRVTIQYPDTPSHLEPERTNYVPIDLVMPEDGDFESNLVIVKTFPGIQISESERSKNVWKWDQQTESGTQDRREYRFSSHTKESRINFDAVIKGEDVLGATVIERLWIQSWLSSSGRFDRIACRIVSNQDSFSLQLPASIRQDRLEVKVNDIPYLGDDPNGAIVDDENRLEIKIDEDQKKKPIILEMSYLLPFDGKMAKGNFDFPKLCGDSIWVRRCYWQVVLPDTQHIFGEVKGWTPEFYDLTWSGFFFRRVSSMGVEELGRWVGVSTTDRIPEKTNIYLFSSFDPPPESHLRMIDRSLLILIGSGITLAFGLVFVYFPKIRYYEIVLAVILLLVGFFIFRPVIVLAFLQTTVFGVFFTFVAYFIKRVLPHKEESLAPPVGKEKSDLRTRSAVSEESPSSKDQKMVEEK